MPECRWISFRPQWFIIHKPVVSKAKDVRRIILAISYGRIINYYYYHNYYYYYYLLTAWGTVLLENLTGLQLVKNFPAFHRNRRFITALTSVRHLYISSASQSPRHGASSGCGGRNGLRYGGELRINWINCSGKPTRGGPPAWGMGEVLTISPCKKLC